MQVSVLKFTTDKKFKKRDAIKLRGYIGNLFRENLLFHNHLEKYEFNYDLAKIQYKVIDKKLSVIGIDDGAKLLAEKFLEINSFIIDGETYSNFEKSLEIKEEDFEVNDKLYNYKFENLWIALNQNNYRKFKDGKFDLDKQIQNNILEIFKGLGIWIDKKIIAKGKFTGPHKFKNKGITMEGFAGEFVCNVKMPSYIGLGKRKSIGFGTIVREE